MKTSGIEISVIDARRKGRRGFTLLELLVVIGIIGVLAALVAAVSQSVMRNGKETKCVGNMHQIGLAFQVYLQSNNQILPKRYYGNINGVDTGYDEMLLPYADNTQIFQCPSQLKTDYPEQPSYGMNWY